MTIHSGRTISMEGPVLITFALRAECSTFLPRLRAFAAVDWLVTGVGRSNAERTVGERIQRTRPQVVLTAGFAGGLRPGLAIGDLLVEPSAGFPWMESLERSGVATGRFYCCDRIVSRAEAKRELWHRGVGDAVEMESGAIQDECRRQGIPCATLRAISDPAEEDLPLDFNHFLRPDQSLHLPRLAWHAVTHPDALRGLLRLRAACRVASERLGDGLLRLLRTMDVR